MLTIYLVLLTCLLEFLAYGKHLICDCNYSFKYIVHFKSKLNT